MDRLLGRAPGPDAAPAPTGTSPPAAAIAPDRPAAAATEPAADNGPDAVLRTLLAAKLLDAWAQNRQQVLLPLAVNLRRLEPASRDLVVQAMAVALAADGRDHDPKLGPDRPRLEAALRRIGGGAEETAAALAALADPPSLLPLLAAVEARGLGPHAYAAAALVLDRHAPAERLFLDWLAARLALPASLTAGLARRYRRHGTIRSD